MRVYLTGFALFLLFGALGSGSLPALAVPLASNFLPYDMSPTYDRVAELRVRDMVSTGRAAIVGGKRYKKVRICVGLRSVEFRKFEITYRGAPKRQAKRSLPIKRIMKPGECTRDISLIGEQGKWRPVKGVEFLYTSYIKSGMQPIVQVYMR